MLQSKLTKEKFTGMEPHFIIQETEMLEQEAKLAFAMIEKWGMVAGVENGEDTAGRQKLRLSTPKELVERAFECAKLGMDTARNRGLVHTIPGLDQSLEE